MICARTSAITSFTTFVNYIFAGPSAQRHVAILSGWSNGQRTLLLIDPGDPSRPDTWRRRILEDTFSTL